MNSKLSSVLAKTPDIYSPCDEGLAEDFCYQEYTGEGPPGEIEALSRASASDFVLDTLRYAIPERPYEGSVTVRFRIAFAEEISMTFRSRHTFNQKERRIRDLVAVMSGKRCIRISTPDVHIDMGTSL